jgi:hypothetical protein
VALSTDGEVVKKGWEIGLIPANGHAIAALAQLVEHRIRNAGVVGSNPIGGTIISFIFNILSRQRKSDRWRLCCIVTPLSIANHALS